VPLAPIHVQKEAQHAKCVTSRLPLVPLLLGKSLFKLGKQDLSGIKVLAGVVRKGFMILKPVMSGCGK